jgi:hypothetical protein
MSERITQKDVLTALDLVKSAAVAAGVTEATNWHLCLCMFAFGRNGVFNRLLDGKIERMA